MDQEEIKKLLKFSIKEKQIIKELNLPEEIFLPLFFSIRFGGDWSLNKNSHKLMSVKEKITHYNEEKQVGYTLERIYLFVNPKLLSSEGKIYRMEKCSNKNEREIVERPHKVTVDGKYILEATLDPKEKKIHLKHIKGPLAFSGPTAYGASHEMEHLHKGEIEGLPFWDFEYVLK
ncbi:MAG: RimK/LysX family protein [Methanobrevibacter sp.]|nr:RimK/LysX family protein [Methanobrevibacter sp.]